MLQTDNETVIRKSLALATKYHRKRALFPSFLRLRRASVLRKLERANISAASIWLVFMKYKAAIAAWTAVCLPRSILRQASNRTENRSMDQYRRNSNGGHTAWRDRNRSIDGDLSYRSLSSGQRRSMLDRSNYLYNNDDHEHPMETPLRSINGRYQALSSHRVRSLVEDEDIGMAHEKILRRRQRAAIFAMRQYVIKSRLNHRRKLLRKIFRSWHRCALNTQESLDHRSHLIAQKRLRMLWNRLRREYHRSVGLKRIIKRHQTHQMNQIFHHWNRLMDRNKTKRRLVQLRLEEKKLRQRECLRALILRKHHTNLRLNFLYWRVLSHPASLLIEKIIIRRTWRRWTNVIKSVLYYRNIQLRNNFIAWKYLIIMKNQQVYRLSHRQDVLRRILWRYQQSWNQYLKQCFILWKKEANIPTTGIKQISYTMNSDIKNNISRWNRSSTYRPGSVGREVDVGLAAVPHDGLDGTNHSGNDSIAANSSSVATSKSLNEGRIDDNRRYKRDIMPYKFQNTIRDALPKAIDNQTALNATSFSQFRKLATEQSDKRTITHGETVARNRDGQTSSESDTRRIGNTKRSEDSARDLDRVERKEKRKIKQFGNISTNEGRKYLEMDSKPLSLNDLENI